MTNFETIVGLFSSLLRLLATHFPHLSLVEDWLEDDDWSLTLVSPKIISEAALADSKHLKYFFIELANGKCIS